MRYHTIKYYLLIFLLLATALTACGTYDTSPNKTSQADPDKSPGLNYTAVSFSLTIDDNPDSMIPSFIEGNGETKSPLLQGEGNLNIPSPLAGEGQGGGSSARTLAKLDCTALSIATIEIAVYDSTGTELVKKSFNCNAHSGNIEVPSGTNRKFVFSGKNSSGVEVYRGEQNSVNLQSGIPVNIGEVKLEILYLLPPIGLTAIAGDGKNTISWNTVTGATSYNIYWSTTTDVTKNTGTKISNVKSPYLHTGLTNGTTYRYAVTAVNSYGESGESDQTSAKYTSVVTLDTTAPANTTGTNFINSGAPASNSTSVILTISATDSVGVTGYYASENSTTPLPSNTGWKSISSTTSYSAGVTFTLSSGDGAKTVYVWFKDAAGNVSNVVSDSITLSTTPTAPTGVTANPGDGQVTISWNVASGATSYNIYWSTTVGATKTTGTKIYSVTSPYTHTGRTNGTAYYYVVTAVNDNGESGESAEVTVTPQAPVRLPKTGQTTCYDSSGNVIGCAGTGQDGELQRGITWPDPRFTDNGDGTVTDKLTGLVWTKDGNAPGPAACSPGTKKTWQVALAYVVCLNVNSYLGYTDWRLPNISEIDSLVHFEQVKIAAWLNLQGFNNVQSDSYWSSTSYASDPGKAWIVGMGFSGTMYGRNKSYDYHYVWPVRSGQSGLLGNSTISIPRTGQTTCYDSAGDVIACSGTGQDGDLQRGVIWPNPRFTDNGNNTVTDNLTGLVWTKDGNAPSPAACSSGTEKTWQVALAYVACLNVNSYLGYTDWRLPNINELGSLVHFEQDETAAWLNLQGFNNVQSISYWSSTSLASLARDGWIWGFFWNDTTFFADKTERHYVWPVRSGQ